jgi:hypothetical protein
MDRFEYRRLRVAWDKLDTALVEWREKWPGCRLALQYVVMVTCGCWLWDTQCGCVRGNKGAGDASWFWEVSKRARA